MNKDSMKDFGDVYLKTSQIGQFEDGLGVYADRDFKKGLNCFLENYSNLSNNIYYREFNWFLFLKAS